MNKKAYNIVFLYTELAGYFLACIRELYAYADVKITIIRWPVNNEAPFEFDLPDEVHVIDRKQINDNKLLSITDSASPDLLFCSGWLDKGYLKVAKKMRRKGIPVICGMDNAWRGTYRQHFASLISSFTVRQYFDYIWVPGMKQKEYALRLGFAPEKILEGYYSADYNFFDDLYHQFLPEKRKSFPHRFFYLGRFVEEKGITDLWRAFELLQKELNTDWELWCGGTGPLLKHAPDVPGLRHVGFIQPKDLPQYIRQMGVFILPSYFEPWGVVVHEMAAAGLPLICSRDVGAASKFLQSGENGFSYRTGSLEDLKAAMEKIVTLNDDQLLSMAEHGNKSSKKITPKKWASTLLSTISRSGATK